MRIHVSERGLSVRRSIVHLLTGTLVVVLAVTVVDGIPSYADEPKKGRESVSERPDRVSAMSTALAQKSRVEDVSARTASSSTYAEKNGSWTVESFSGPVRTQDENGKWVDLDTDVTRDGGTYVPKSSAVDLAYSDGGNKTLAVVKTDDAKIGVGVGDSLPAPQVKDSTLTYPGGAGGNDLVVTSLKEGFNYSVTLDEAPSRGEEAPEFRFPLTLEGATARIADGGGIEFVDGNKRIASAPTPTMWDATRSESNDDSVRNVDVELRGSGDTAELVLKPDVDFLTDPSTQYPVTVDPTFVVAATADTWVQSTGDTSSQIASPELRVGSNDSGATKARTFVYFDLANMSTMPAFEVNSAKVNLSNFESGSCQGSDLELSRITGGWFTGSVTWGNQPAVASAGASRSSQAFGADGCASEGVVSFNATDIVKSWKSGSTNLGVRIAAVDETAASGWRKFRSNEAGLDGHRVRLLVNYNSYPTKPANAQATPAISDGSTLVTASKQPKFTATVGDPDGGTLDVRFKLTKGSTVIQNSVIGSAAAGSEVFRTPAALSDGTYEASWQTSDGQLESEWSDPVTIDVDTTPPPAPSVSCTGLTNGSWYDTRPAATSTCTVSAGSGTHTIEASLNGDTLSMPDLSSGSTSKTIDVPENGVVELDVVAKDKAGNAATTTFRTGTGTGALVAPSDQDRSADAFTVAAKSKGGATSAKMQWRNTGDTAGAWTDATQVKNGLIGWLGLVTTTNGVATTGPLTWNAAAENGLEAPATVETRFCFNYSSAPAQRCTSSRTVNLVEHATGGSFPASDIGPGQVALLTGEYVMDESDLSVPGYGSDLSVGRTYQSLTNQPASTQAGVFGPGWVADITGPDAGYASAQVIDKSATNGTITLVDTDGTSSSYLHSSKAKGAQKAGTYKGIGEAALDNDKLTIDSTKSVLTLLEEDGTKTVWKHLGAGKWSVDKVDEPGSNGTTNFTLDADGRVTGIYAPAPSGVTCTAASQTKGCRALLFTYTTVGSDKRLSRVDLRTWDPKPDTDGTTGASAAMSTIAVAKYDYNSAGRLTAAWDPRTGDGASALKTTYSYQTIGSWTVLETVTEPGQKPWRFEFDSLKRLEKIKREQDSSVSSGDATWSIAYDLATNGSGLPDLSPSAVSSWGQSQAPVASAAVFEPDAPGTTDYTYANLSYFTKEGRTTNTASYGAGAWQIDSSVYDSQGNVIWQLDEGNRNRALAGGGDTAAAANLLSTKTAYSADGVREKATWEPARPVKLANGTDMVGRPKTVTVYDDEADASLTPGRPAPDPDAPAKNLVVEKREFIASVDDTTGYDLQRTRYRYDPVVSGDGNGWTLGAPTRVSTALTDTTNSTELTRFDTDGKTIETRTPEGVATTDGTGSDARSTFTRYYTADASSPDAACRNKPEWVGQVCSVVRGATYSSIPTERTAGYDYLLNPTRVVESSSPMERISITAYDEAGRKTRESLTMNGDLSGNKPIAATTYSYSATTGDLKSTTSGGKTIETTVDTWGRLRTYTDGEGNTATTTYDTAGRTKTFDDGKGTYTYTYDGQDANGETERRGLVTKLDVGLASGPSQMSAAYDADGQNIKTVYPNGMTATSVYDQAGQQTSLRYAQGSVGLIGFARIYDPHGRVRFEASSLSQTGYNYDGRERLTHARDYVAGRCTTRRYALSLDSNRTSLTTYEPGAGGECSSSTSSTDSSSFDIQDRITDNGYAYDYFGRTRAVPKAHTNAPNGSDLEVRSYANDMVASLRQRVTSSTSPIIGKSYGLDAAQRIGTIDETSDGAELRKVSNHYSDDSDAAAWYAEQTRPNSSSAWQIAWTRSVLGIDGDLALTETSGGAARIHIVNLHGDVVSTLTNSTGSGSSGLENYSESTEYGLTRAGFSPLAGKFGWLGSKRRSTDTVGGLTLVGVRLYNPSTGRFLSRDPVAGGNDNDFAYPVDPVNKFDLDGRWGRRFWRRAAKWTAVGAFGVCVVASAGACVAAGVAAAAVSARHRAGRWRGRKFRREFRRGAAWAVAGGSVGGHVGRVYRRFGRPNHWSRYKANVGLGAAQYGWQNRYANRRRRR